MKPKQDDIERYKNEQNESILHENSKEIKEEMNTGNQQQTTDNKKIAENHEDENVSSKNTPIMK